MQVGQSTPLQSQGHQYCGAGYYQQVEAWRLS